MERIHSTKAAVLPAAEEVAGVAARRMTDQLLQSVERSVVADFRYREAERVVALGLDEGRAQSSRHAADRHNAACLDLLTDQVPTAIEDVRREFGDLEIDARQALSMFAEEVRYQVSEADFTGEQAAKAERVLDETIATAEASGIRGLCDRLDEHVDDFIELRRERPHHNNPVAFVVGGILAGIGAIMLGICWAVSGPGGCTNGDVLFWSGAFISSGLFIILASVFV